MKYSSLKMNATSHKYLSEELAVHGMSKEEETSKGHCQSCHILPNLWK